MNVQHRILIVDDTESLLDTLSGHLKAAGYLPITAANGQQALIVFHDEHPDLVILDVNMPAMDGWTVASRIREVSQVPIIMLTAQDAEEDKVRGFSLGVDDYMTKPFSLNEVEARIAAVLRRAAPQQRAKEHIYLSDNLAIDLDARRVTREGQPVELTPTEFRLLEVLVRHEARPLSHAYILSEVWGPGYEGEVDHIKHYIWSLRKKIEEDPASPSHILTEHRFGYRFQ